MALASAMNSCSVFAALDLLVVDRQHVDVALHLLAGRRVEFVGDGDEVDGVLAHLADRRLDRAVEDE